jgi:hypothetical protein
MNMARGISLKYRDFVTIFASSLTTLFAKASFCKNLRDFCELSARWRHFGARRVSVGARFWILKQNRRSLFDTLGGSGRMTRHGGMGSNKLLRNDGSMFANGCRHGPEQAVWEEVDRLGKEPTA